MNKQNKTKKKMMKNIINVIVLAAFLCFTTLAIFYSMVPVNDNTFHTGEININLNDGKPIIDEEGMLFEPGMKVEKTFFLENKGPWDVYYRLYLDEIYGDLSDVLDIKIKYADKILYSGKALDLTKEKVMTANDILKVGQRREFHIQFYYPIESGNEYQNQILSFTMGAEAVQTKNNPKGLFS